MIDLERTSVDSQQTTSSTSLNQEQSTWTTKEKLFLISFILLNGDSNWSFISEHFNKWMQMTSTSSSSQNNKRTSFECSKQYKTILRNYTKKHGQLCDLKAIYQSLSDERIKELKEMIVQSRQHYNDLCTEIQQVLNMDMKHFEQLSKIWLNTCTMSSLKTPEKLNNNSNRTLLEIFNEMSEIQRTQTDQLDADEIELRKNIKSLLVYNKKQEELRLKEEEERKRKQLEMQLAAQQAAEQQRQQQLLIEKQKQLELEKKQSELKQKEKEQLERKSNQADISNNSEENSGRKEKTGETDLMKSSQEGIEWKPVVEVNESDKIDDSQSEEANTKATNERSASRRKQPISTTPTVIGSRRSQRVIESSSNTSSSEDDKNEANKMTKDETGVLNRTRASSKIQTTTSNISSNKTRSNTINNEQVSDASELIFAPLIKTVEKSNEGELDGELSEHQTHDEKQSEDASEQNQQQNEQEEASNRNNRSLRSKSKQVQSSTNLNNASFGKGRRSITAAKQAQKANDQPVSSSSSSNLTSTNNSPKLQANKSATGELVSLIKSEPIQIKSEPTNDAKSEDTESNINTSISTRSSASKFDDEKSYRAWKKSISMVHTNISCHKHATIFMQPVREDIAPGYKNVVLKPMDLNTIKKNIENGSIKSTVEFQRDIMLMFTNAIMYNSSNHDVHKISLEMYKEVLNDIEQLLNAQEAIGEEAKPLRFIRSSTASDRGNETDLKNETSLNDASNEPVVNLLMKSKKDMRDERLETSSIKSGSSLSTRFTSNSNATSINKSKLDNSSIKSTSSNSKKRRASSEQQTQTHQQPQTPPAQSKSKRRKSGR